MHKSVIVLVILLTLFSTQVRAEPFSVAISRPDEQSIPQRLATDYLIKLLAERSRGEINVELVADADNQIKLVTLIDAANVLPQLKFLQLPFLFSDRQHLYQFLATEAGQRAFSADRQPELIPLALWDLGFDQLVTGPEMVLSDGGISGSWQTISDMQYNAVSAQARLLSQLAQEQPLHASQLILSNHRLNAIVLSVTRSFWDATPDNLKVIIMGAIKDATLYFRELAQQEELQSLKTLKSGTMKIYTPTPIQRKNWQTEARETYPHAMSDADLQLIEVISNLAPAN